MLPEEIECEHALPWGSVRLARHLWEQVNLPAILGRLCRSPRSFAVAETAFVLVANRLCEPCSEHGLARWLEHTFVCDSAGRRWTPDWLPAERITKQQRVKVRSRQLNKWYRTLDALLAARYFVIDSVERKAYEEEMRQASMKRAKEALEKVAQAVAAGRLKDPAKIGARAARAGSRHHGYRYYSWAVPGRGQFRFGEDPDKLHAEMRHEGKYILKTDDAAISAVEAVAAYKELHTVESGFRDLKDVIEMRPIHHKTDKRVLGHLFVATLALFLKRTLEYQLAERLPTVSGTEALAAMKSVGVSELDLNGCVHRLVSGGGRDARRVVKALGITPLGPPGTKNPPGMDV